MLEPHPEPPDEVIADFARKRVDQAFRELQRVIADDYAEFMAHQTGFHPDYFLPLERL